MDSIQSISRSQSLTPPTVDSTSYVYNIFIILSQLLMPSPPHITSHSPCVSSTNSKSLLYQGLPLRVSQRCPFTRRKTRPTMFTIHPKNYANSWHVISFWCGLCTGKFYPNISRLLHRHWANDHMMPVPVKQTWWKRVDMLQYKKCS